MRRLALVALIAMMAAMAWSGAVTGAEPEAPAVEVKVDSLGDPLPEGASLRLGTLRFRSPHEMPTIAYSPKGDMVATGSRDNKIEVWNAADGRRLLTLEVSAGEAGVVAFSPDNKMLAVGGDSVVDIFELSSGKRKGSLDTIDFTVMALAFDGRGKTLAVGGSSPDIVLYDVGRGQVTGTLSGHTGAISAMRFAPRGAGFASASLDGTLKMWKLGGGGGKVGTSIDAHDGAPVVGLDWARNGKALVTAGGKAVRLWDTRKLSQIEEIDGHGERVTAVSFSPDSASLAVAAANNEVVLWDVKSGAEIHRLKARSPLSVDFSPKGDRLVAGGDGFHLWMTESGVDMLAGLGHRNAARSLAFFKNEQLASGGGDKDSYVWNLSTGRAQRTFANSAEAPYVAVSANGRLLAAGGGGTKVQIWDVGLNKVLHDLTSHTRPVIGVAFSPQGETVATSSLDGMVRLWDARTGTQTRRLSGSGGFARALAFSPGGRTLATGAHKDWFGGEQGGVAIWHVETGALMSTILTGDSAVIAVAFSPDGKLLATGHQDAQIRLWEVASGNPMAILSGHTSHVRAVAFNATGDMLASGSSDKSVRLWGLDGRQLKELKGHAGVVYDVGFSPDNQRLASASADSTVLVWELSQLKLDQGAEPEEGAAPEGSPDQPLDVPEGAEGEGGEGTEGDATEPPPEP